MRRPLLIAAVLAAATPSFAQLQRIVLEGAGEPQLFTDINAAIAAAQPNDRLYLSGGTFGSATTITIGIPLHIIGAGTGPDSSSVTGTTIIATSGTNDIVITTGATGSTFTGVRFDPGRYFQYGTSEMDDDPTDILFERCTFDTRWIAHNNSSSGSSSTVFNECIFHSFLYGADGTSATLTRCILDYQAGTGAEVSGFNNGLTMRFCVALGTRITSSSCVIENCIFTRTSAPVWQSNGAILTNNLCVSTSLTSNMSGFVATGNELSVPVTDIFISEDNTDFEWTDDLHLQPSSIGVGMATDGTDVGIHGSSSPSKPGAVPFNPHFRSAVIAPATDANGDLPVNVRVAAQTH